MGAMLRDGVMAGHVSRAAHFKTESIFLVYDRILSILNVSKTDFKISLIESLKRTQ